MTRLALFDLDHTLLSGDTDVLWCDFLIDEGRLDRATFGPRNESMAERYARGEASAAEFCGFYAETLRGIGGEEGAALRERFFSDRIASRIPASARALIAQHRERGDTLVLTTATNRFLTELTATDLGIDALIATELEQAEGRFTGRIRGTPNMREGKVERLHEWLAQRQRSLADFRESWFYSDSQNDLPLLSRVTHPVAVNPDPVLASHARHHAWAQISLADA